MLLELILVMKLLVVVSRSWRRFSVAAKRNLQGIGVAGVSAENTLSFLEKSLLFDSNDETAAL